MRQGSLTRALNVLESRVSGILAGVQNAMRRYSNRSRWWRALASIRESRAIWLGLRTELEAVFMDDGLVYVPKRNHHTVAV